ncbi:MAG: hypothetical protein SH857_04020 [Chitinophagales bacterium]|nr:hypothetical protein [Chitinophagales bacterium]
MNIEKPSFGQKVAKTTKKITMIVLGSLLLIGIAVLSFLYWGVYDEGVRAGKILRISKQGVVFKTYEGQLSMEAFGSLKGASPIAETFDFSVENSKEAIIKDLEAVALSGERVNLHYVKRYRAFPWRGASKYYIVQVERSPS